MQLLIAGVVSGIMALGLSSQIALAQNESSTVATLERVAAEAALEHTLGATWKNMVLGVDPMVVYRNEAPGGRDSTARPPARQGALTSALRGRTMPRGDVMDCTSPPCRLKEVDAYVTLSAPAISGDSASVTVTTLRKTKSGRLQYRTVNVNFVKGIGTWKVVGFDELGIS